MKNPIQPTELDNSRFKENKIVRYLLDHGPFDMNHLARLNFSNDDRQQFAQLIGYSLSGYSDLGYVDDEAYNAACLMAKEGLTEQQARINHLETELKALKDGMREAVARLYEIHPDNLGESDA